MARDTLNGYLKGKREVYTPWYYWFAAKLYGLAPGLIEWGITRRLPMDQATGSAPPRRESLTK